MSAYSSFRVGIVGCGLIAHVHARAYQQLGAKIVWVYDVSQASIDRYAKEFQFQVAPSLEAIADRNKIDVVNVCSPPACHLENVLPLIEAGIPVLCEKPLAADLVGAEKIAAAVRHSKGTPFMVGFCHRFDPRVVELSKIVFSGRLGRPVLLRQSFGHYSDVQGSATADPKLAGGGAMMGNGSHSADLFRWLVGEPTRVQAMAGTLDQKLAIDDVAMMQLSMNDKTFGELVFGYSLHFGQYSLEYYGTEGAAVVNYHDRPPMMRYRLAKDADWTTVDCSNRTELFVNEIRHFLDCVRDGTTPLPSAEDGLQAARIIDAAYRSAREGRNMPIVT